MPSPALTLPDHLALAATRHGPMLFPRGDAYIGVSLAHYGEYSHLEFDLLRQLVRPGDTIVEVGANIGAHTIPLARLAGPEGRVLALEPQRIIFQILCANLVLNGVLNVEALPLALGDAAGLLHVPPLDYAAHGNFGGVSLHGEAGEPVAVRTLDSFDLPALRLLKIDVEGMEGPVIAGAAAAIRRHRPILYVENDRQDRSPALIRQIRALGYRQFWHLPPLFNPDNQRQVAENVFGTTISINMLCVPEEVPVNVALLEVTDPDLSWRTAHAAARQAPATPA